MSGMMQLHSAIGTGSGATRDRDGREVPIVTMHFAKDQSVIDRMEEEGEDFDPSDEANWRSVAMTIRAARQLIADLEYAVDSAITGPPPPPA